MGVTGTAMRIGDDWREGKCATVTAGCVAKVWRPLGYKSFGSDTQIPSGNIAVENGAVI